MTTVIRSLSLALTSVIVLAAPARAQDPLAAARDLYASAAYEDALARLDALRDGGAAALSVADVELLRAFCLLALGRETEAAAAIEDVVTERPLYLPGEDEAAPRVRAAFREVRRRLLPAIARRLYQTAREDFERKAHESAASKFSELLQILEDPDMAGESALADLRLVAAGFRDLSAAAIASASSPAAPARTPETGADASSPAVGGGAAAAATAPAPANGASPAAGTSAASSAPLPPAITPPVPINQKLPPWRPASSASRWGQFRGVLDLIIDEQGRVESATIRQSIHPQYDLDLLKAARTWTYTPARRGNQPIKYRKTLVVRLNEQE
ncbi:MAG TPA: hypothetical protein VNI83_07980 [Vicinamibacterales bacterium]|nr:hypothetical protein [Vicinamibacterales bacterium]